MLLWMHCRLVYQKEADVQRPCSCPFVSAKKHMQANLPADKKWMNATFLKALKDMVASGELVKTKASYKLSAVAKQKASSAGKPKKAPKKKVAPKKTAPKKKSAPKKKAVSCK